MNKQKGFTLIELIVVVAIVAITATVGIRWWNGRSNSPEQEEAREVVACEDGNRVLRSTHESRQLYGTDGKPQRCAADEK